MHEINITLIAPYVILALTIAAGIIAAIQEIRRARKGEKKQNACDVCCGNKFNAPDVYLSIEGDTKKLYCMKCGRVISDKVKKVTFL